MLLDMNTHSNSLKSKLKPDLAQQPLALSPLSAVAPSDEPPVLASPPFLHHILCLERGSIEMISLHVHGNTLLYRRSRLSFQFVLTGTLGS